MGYKTQCTDTDPDENCPRVLRFSNPRLEWLGDTLGVAFDPENSGVHGPADAASVLNLTAPAVAAWRDRPADDADQSQAATGALPDRLAEDVSAGSVDQAGAALGRTASSPAPPGETARTENPRETGAASPGPTATPPSMVTLPEQAQ